MAVYVDSLMHRGWVLRGKPAKNAHLFADSIDELLAFATGRLGLRERWFQCRSGKLPHFDLAPRKFAEALAAGAIYLGDREQAVRKMREIKGREAARWNDGAQRLRGIVQMVAKGEALRS